MYFPPENTCMTVESTSETPSLNDVYAIRSRAQLTPGAANAGSIEAISVETGASDWKRE